MLFSNSLYWPGVIKMHWETKVESSMCAMSLTILLIIVIFGFIIHPFIRFGGFFIDDKQYAVHVS